MFKVIPSFAAVRGAILMSVLGALSAGSMPGANASVLKSPDERIQVSVQMPAPGSKNNPHWSATFRGKQILSDCEAGSQIAGAGDLLTGVRLVRERTRSVNQRVRI